MPFNMNRFNFKTTIFCLAISLFTLAGCSKDNPYSQIIDERKDFAELNASDQEDKIIEGLQKYLGNKYKLLYVTTIREDERITEYPSECEEKITITLPDEVNVGKYILQDAEDNSCALNWHDALKMDLRLYGFTNFKIGLPFFTGIHNTLTGLNEYSADMFFYVDESQGINVDNEYLVLFEPSKEDLNEATNHYNTVACEFEKRYEFVKVN